VRTAVVLMTHRFDESILDEFHRIREGLGATDQAFLLSDGSAATPAPVAPWTHTFDFAHVSRRASQVIGADILRNVHLAWIDFFEANPEFDAYWLIEYDVLYSGSWNELFDAFREHPCDLLCTHLRAHAQEPGWFWWPQIHAPAAGPALPEELLLRGFLPISRFSRRGFERLRDAVDEGWAGFLEGLVPTLFLASGLSIGDIGGDGPFVPEGFRNRFYTSASDADGSLRDLGTMRFAPPILFPRILPGRLYHPVKPEPNTFDAGAHQPRLACEALGRALRVLAEQPSPAPADHQLQILTGLSSIELGEALDRMEANGLETERCATLRRELLDLTPSLDAQLRFPGNPVEGKRHDAMSPHFCVVPVPWNFSFIVSLARRLLLGRASL
jgi:hypothetical protein